MRARELFWIFSLGLLCGVVGEALLFIQQQCVKAEAMLVDDFRVLAFLSADMSASKEKDLEGQVRSLEGVADVRYISREAMLSSLQARDASMVQSVALLGENPLGALLEIRLKPEALPKLAEWVAAASKRPELSDLRFKPRQVQAILQFRFYRHFMALVMSLAALPWFLGAALGFWVSVQDPRSSVDTPLPRLALAAIGTLAGMALLYAAASPMRSSALWLWPPLRSQWALVLAGTLGAGFWIETQPGRVVKAVREIAAEWRLETTV